MIIFWELYADVYFVMEEISQMTHTSLEVKPENMFSVMFDMTHSLLMFPISWHNFDFINN